MNITPRLFNVISISLVLCMLCWVGIQSNTAQDAPDVAIEERPAAPTGELNALEPPNPEVTADETTTSAEGTTEPTLPVFPELPSAEQDGFIPSSEPLPLVAQEQLATPTLVVGTATRNSAPLSWDATPHATGYVIEQSTDDGKSWGPAATLTNGATAETTVSGLAVNTSYQFRIKATALGYADSNWSASVTLVPQANYQGLITLALFLVLVFGTYWIGNATAKSCRLPEHGFKIFIVLLSFFGGFAALAMGWNRLTLGIDLQGGVVLIYDAKPIQGGTEDVAVTGGINMDQLTRAIGKRINPGGVREIAITQLGQDKVQIVIPHAEASEVARIERVVSESGALTFRVLASPAFADDDAIIKRGEAEAGRDILDTAGKPIARWVPIFESQRSDFVGNPDYVLRERGKTLEALVKFDDGVNITGEHLTYVGRGIGPKGGPGVSFNFNAVGANKCGRLTSANLPDATQSRLKRHLGIVLNDYLYSAPVINSTIRDSGIIEFNAGHTESERKRLNQDIQDLIDILQAGALPAELSKEPAGRMQIGATLGKDTIQKAQYSLVTASLITIAFMLTYYRLAGVIASFCVITNTVLIIAIMLSLRAAFTLPGLAGLVLTLGMAVDANILISERIREELRGGASIKMAIRNGYAKAFSAIFDSNITTIFVGCILYGVGTEQVKGFAVTLVLGIALNLFTAIFCARVIMDVLATQRWVTTFRMMQLFKRPNINFLKARHACIATSLAVILIGLFAVGYRGRGILDIDFVGGVSVEAVFTKTQNIAAIRAKLDSKNRTINGAENKLNDLAVQNIQASKDNEGNEVLEDTRFIITNSIPQVKIDGKNVSSDTYLETVKSILRETFGDDLEYCSLDYTIGETRSGTDYDETVVEIKRFPQSNYESLNSEIRAKIRQAAAEGQIEGEFSPPSVSRPGYGDADGNPQRPFADWTLTFRIPRDNLETVLKTWKTELDSTPNFPTTTTVGGSVAQHTRIQGLMAILASLVFLAIYISVRFRGWQYGLVAVVGLIHNVLVVLGLLALSRWFTSSILLIDEFKVGLPVVAAFLTVIAYALNDTIILFDRIRENLGKSTILYGSMINTAINQTLSRTVLTSATTLLVAMILYAFGGQGIHSFSFVISVGVAVGTYSTICICSPLLFWIIGHDDLGPSETMRIEKMER